MSSTPPESPYGPAVRVPGPVPVPVPVPVPAPSAYGAGGYAPVAVENRWGDAARDAWSVNVRCQAVLAALALLAGVAVGVSEGEAAQIMIYVWLVHVVVTLVVGYPLGVVSARLLPAAATRGAAAGGFLLAGGVAGALAMAWAGPFAALGWAGLGALTAGGARAWAHGVIERRRARTRPPVPVVPVVPVVAGPSTDPGPPHGEVRGAPATEDGLARG